MSFGPDATNLRLQTDVRVGAAGWVLGGSPTRLIRLAPQALLRSAEDRGLRVPPTGGAHLIDLGVAWFKDSAAPSVHPDQVSVVIPARCRPADVDPLLAGLSGLDVVLVDDCSPEPLNEVAQARGARYARLTENLGPAGARNVGFEMTSTPYVVFCDADTRATTADLLSLVRHLAYEKVAACAPRVRSRNLTRPTWISRYDIAVSSLDLGASSGVARPGGRVPWVPSAVLAVRRDALGNRPFDARMRSGEDVDLVWRLDAGGWLVYYDADLVVDHEPRPTFLPWARRKTLYGTSAGPLYLRHGSAVAPVRMNNLQLAAAVSLLAGRHRLSAALFVAHAVRVWRTLGATDLDRNLRKSVTWSLTRSTVAQTVHAGLGVWLPFALASRRGRRFVLVAAALDGIATWVRLRPPLDPFRFIAARRADQTAYAIGVWAGAIRSRTWGPLLPGSPHAGSAPRTRAAGLPSLR